MMMDLLRKYWNSIWKTNVLQHTNAVSVFQNVKKKKGLVFNNCIGNGLLSEVDSASYSTTNTQLLALQNGFQ